MGDPVTSDTAKLALDRVSLCGVTSLCDVLPHLSLPSPLPHTQDKSLLFRYIYICSTLRVLKIVHLVYSFEEAHVFVVLF